MVQESETCFDDKCMSVWNTALQITASLYLSVEFSLFLFNFWCNRGEEFMKKCQCRLKQGGQNSLKFLYG